MKKELEQKLLVVAELQQALKDKKKKGKMKKYIVEVSRGYTYRVPVEAKDEYEAREIVREMSNDLIEDFEVTAFWDFQFGEEVTE